MRPLPHRTLGLYGRRVSNRDVEYKGNSGHTDFDDKTFRESFNEAPDNLLETAVTEE